MTRLIGINRDKAITNANQYARKHNYKNVELIDSNFSNSEIVGTVYLFNFYDENDDKQIHYIGLPNYIAVDNLTGNTYEVRVIR